MNMNNFQIVKHLVTCGDLICEPFVGECSYKVGEIVSLGECDGEVISVYHRKQPPNQEGYITYKILAEVILNKYGKEVDC